MGGDSSSAVSSTVLLASVKQLIAGGAGGICLVLAGHPMDTIKVRIQTMSTPKPGEIAQFSGTLDCVTKTLRHEGVRGFYKGMLAPLIGATPVNAVVFFGYGIGVRLQTGGSPTAVDNLTYGELFKAGCFSGLCTSFINTPVERIKCLMQIEQGSVQSGKTKYKGFLDCATKVYANGGIRSSYRGLIACFCRDIPGSGFYFMGYEYLKRNGPELFYTNNTTVITLMAGGFAGVFYWIFGIPADVIKSKVQTAPDGKYANNFRDVIKSMYAKRGLLAFYRGATPVFIRSFPANAACFFGYEYAMKFLNMFI